MSIARAAYLKGMENQGPHRLALATSALALAEALSGADPQEKLDIAKDLSNEVYRVLTQVMNWKPHDARFAAQELARSMRRVQS